MLFNVLEFTQTTWKIPSPEPTGRRTIEALFKWPSRPLLPFERLFHSVSLASQTMACWGCRTCEVTAVHSVNSFLLKSVRIKQESADSVRMSKNQASEGMTVSSSVVEACVL
jgi:hypothetical protein